MTPEGWRRVAVADLASAQQNSFVIGPFGSDLVVADYTNSGVPVIFVRDVKPNALRWKSNVFVSHEKADQLRAHKVLPGDVVITKMGLPAGIAAVYPEDLPAGVVTADIIRLRPDGTAADSRFLSEALNAPLAAEQVAKITGGQTRPKLTLRDYKAIQILLPPLPEQRKIAAILSSVDDAIESTQSVIDQLGVVKQALMAELLTRGLPGRHTRFKQTEIGEVPEEWEVVRAETVFADGPSNGRSPPSKASPPGVPTFSISAVRNGQVNIASNVKYAEADPASVRAALVHRGDILIVRGNGNPELVGLCGMVVEEPPDGCIYPDILMRVRPSPALLPDFLVTLWNSQVVHDQVLDKAKTTNGTYKINGQDVRDMLVPLPSAREQQLIGDAVRSVETSGRVHAEKLAGLQHLKSALMSVLLTGEVRVKPDEEAA